MMRLEFGSYCGDFEFVMVFEVQHFYGSSLRLMPWKGIKIERIEKKKKQIDTSP
jgi:hypothetical protein